MTWIVWALMLISHGAFSRWAKARGSYATASFFGDILLIAIGLVTIERLQGLDVQDILRVAIFFVAFGAAGQQLMQSILAKGTDRNGTPRVGA